jgi:hypothetical protein
MKRRPLAALLVVLTAAFVSLGAQQKTLPDRLTDAEFWQLHETLSEPPGSFRSENLVSNETMFQWPIPELVKTVTPGNVYMGVAPDQNFTYMAALKPKMAFIVDIRRGNVLQHLMYKALFELSADRAEFLARLFSMSKLKNVTATSSPRELFDAVYLQKADQKLFEENTKTMLDLLIRKHGFKLSKSDEEQFTWIYNCFFTYGPDLTYQACESRNGFGGFSGGRFGGGFGAFRSYADLQLQTDASGANWAYMASDAAFRWMKDFEAKNLLVPVTGDFMGPKAIRAVGEYLKERGGVVGSFYLSNVEQYLFQTSTWNAFYANVATLPLDAGSQFIRSVPNSNITPAQPGARAASMLCSMKDQVAAFAAGQIASYWDVIKMSRQ